MPAARYPLKLEQGATFHRTVRWMLSAEGGPVDMTGYNARMQIRARANSPKAIATLSTVDGSITVDGATGTLSLRMTAADTQRLPAGTAVYDLHVVSSAGDVTKLLAGPVNITEGVTR